MDIDLNQIEEIINQIGQAQTLEEVDALYLKLMGKSGYIATATRSLSVISKDQVKEIAPKLTQLRQLTETATKKTRLEIKEKEYEKLDLEQLDLTTFEKIKQRKGHLHPVTQFEIEIAELFSKLGFQQFDAPHIDTDENNFELLNIPDNHPARDLWDTLYIDQSKLKVSPGKLLLRTHTSNSQVHIMKGLKPPFRMMSIGRCFRYENLDARHEHTFDQFELIYIDKGVNMGNLQYLSEYFLKAVFGSDIKVRLKPKYYPFVEPGAGVDGQCIFCHGAGCKVCSNSGWLELAGAGMIHPNVLRNGGIDPKKYSGIAWGFGPERMVMLKYGIEDIRLLKSGNLKFLERY
ncbi:phenylalanine--tRNA ligase subunit alpha [Candidatus Daviesbacteria bacterium RIFCSPLOWO2_02_FULL_40_8]|nr:MAG: phenylalanine--tRNA ligase subunit alpha [Candidatus Daviesbacteria bacterium RIFCSPHIGHO2_01_FULL_41_45]OGE66043.1 MAG: phenylalanine--tRNA ligase subunit alpha [Candidatus Daviesbacteria bacterium RIFCSPLOWO2_02_FULL_40_8]